MFLMRSISPYIWLIILFFGPSELTSDLKFIYSMRKSVEGLILQFANNFGKLVEDSSLDFLGVDSIKYVEGMRVFH